MSDFAKCNGSEFSLLQNDLISVQTLLQDAYNRVSKLQASINQGDWTGKSKVAMQAYLDLLLQYHGAFIGKQSNPVQEAVNALNELIKNLENFYDQCKVYQDLEKLS